MLRYFLVELFLNCDNKTDTLNTYFETIGKMVSDLGVKVNNPRHFFLPFFMLPCYHILKGGHMFQTTPYGKGSYGTQRGRPPKKSSYTIVNGRKKPRRPSLKKKK
jgi:hypothetical protein